MNNLYSTRAEKYTKYRWDYAAEAIVAIFDIVGISKQTIVAVLTLAGKVAQVVPNTGLDFKNASAGPDAIVYEQFGAIHLYDPRSGKSRRLDVRVAGARVPIQVDVGHNVPAVHRGMGGEIERPQLALLLGRHGNEDD